MLCAQWTSEALTWVYRTKVPPSPGVENSGISCSCAGPCQCGDNLAYPYVDDVVGVAPAEFASHLFNKMLELMASLQLTPSKTPGHIVPPSEVCVALGFCINLSNNTISIPREKLDTIIALLLLWVGKVLATKREIQSLTGKLLFCSKVITPGRLHLNRMLETQRRANNLDTPVPLNENFQADVLWWLANIRHWNGISLLDHSPSGHVSVDASSNGWFDGGPGVGAFNHKTNQFFKTGVPDEFREWPICDLELLAHILAARIWHNEWRGQEIRGETDNEATHNFLLHGRSRIDRRLVMGRTFSAMEHQWDFRWRSNWLSTHDNKLADYCSRWGSVKAQSSFWSLCASLGISPTER